jgi:hypothetical protein
MLSFFSRPDSSTYPVLIYAATATPRDPFTYSMYTEHLKKLSSFPSALPRHLLPCSTVNPLVLRASSTIPRSTQHQRTTPRPSSSDQRTSGGEQPWRSRRLWRRGPTGESTREEATGSGRRSRWTGVHPPFPGNRPTPQPTLLSYIGRSWFLLSYLLLQSMASFWSPSFAFTNSFFVFFSAVFALPKSLCCSEICLLFFVSCSESVVFVIRYALQGPGLRVRRRRAGAAGEAAAPQVRLREVGLGLLRLASRPPRR